MQSRLLFVLGLLLVPACGAGSTDPRTEEIWAIDFETYGGEVDRLLEGAGVDLALLEPRVIEHLESIFVGIDVEFRLGSAWGSALESSICIREGDTERIGRGILNIGNSSATHDCGEPDGTRHGAFLDQLVPIFLAQDDVSDVPEVRADQLAKLLSVVLAHEIGHGLGLYHATSDWGIGDVMKTLPVFDFGVQYYFSPPDRTRLAANVQHGVD